MNFIISNIRDALKVVEALVRILQGLRNHYLGLRARVNAAPGLPVENPNNPYWLHDPPYPELVDIKSPELPVGADVVIIGSGITAAAVAKALLEANVDPESRKGHEETSNDSDRGEMKEANAGTKPGPRIVVLEARQLCSGATGRNGGHIKAQPHETFARLRKSLCPAQAAELVRFQLQSFGALKSICDEEGIAIAECREVETADLYLEEEGFEKAKEMVTELAEWVPEFKTTVWNGEKAKRWGTNDRVVGAISYRAGAIWPYRFVTSIWRTLLDVHPFSLAIETSTPVTSVAISSSSARPYLVHTHRGIISARHVVHATNAWASHLVPGLRGKMTGVVAHMTAQRPGEKFAGSPEGKRSWSVVYGQGADYVTQRAASEDGTPGDLLLGGGRLRSGEQGLDAIGSYDDGVQNENSLVNAHLWGIFPALFGPENWGVVSGKRETKKTCGTQETVDKTPGSMWSGIISITGDFRPFVGRIDGRLTGRVLPTVKPKKATSEKAATGVAAVAPGEWISAGYCGDGMVWAWLCGTALGKMLADDEAPGGFPETLSAKWERVKKMDLVDLLDEIS